MKKTGLRVMGLLLFAPVLVFAQIDPVRRDLIQFGYDQAIEGRGPFSGYAFYYHNQPNFLHTNLTLRLAVAPVYLDSELGINSGLGPHTDVAIGLAGGGFADSYNEIRGGKFLPHESFTGNGAEISASLYHLFNPEDRVPLNLIVRGTVFMNNGAVFCDTLKGTATLNFPGSMFQWAGGWLGGRSSTFLTNAGTINLSGPAVMDQYFANNGTIIQSGAGDNNDNTGQLFNNGVYQIQNDNGAAINYFYNYGLLEKTGGSGTSVISATFNNSDAIQATSGTLLFTGGTFNQNAGTLQITPSITFTNQAFNLNGGTVTGESTLGDNNVVVNGGVLAPGNPFGTLNVPFAFNLYSGAFNVVLGGTNQFSQLAVGGNAAFALNSTLNVTLTNGYAPAIGTQFKILSCANLGGRFAALNVPQGISVNYSNNGVYLVMTGPAPAQLQSPQITGGNFNFSFGTINGWSYTIQQNTNLATTNWTFYTNITGNGSLYQFSVPVTNIPPGFFRVSQP